MGNAAVSKTRHPNKCSQKQSRNQMKMRQEGGKEVSIIEKCRVARRVVTPLYSTALLYSITTQELAANMLFQSLIVIIMYFVINTTCCVVCPSPMVHINDKLV